MSSRVIMSAIKNDSNLDVTKKGKVFTVRGIEYAVDALARQIETLPFLRVCLNKNVALVPLPRSAPLSSPDALWPSKRICEALVAAGLGAEVAPFLKRIKAVQKAATASKGMRPSHEQHYESTAIDEEVPSLIKKPFTIVDDIVTRGSSFIGTFARLAAAFPGRQIYCFAMMRTESDGEVESFKGPTQGKIRLYPSGKTWRSVGSEREDSLL